MTVDLYLYERATGRILQRTMGDGPAVAAMTSDTLSVVEWEPNTSDATHEVDIATGRLRLKVGTP